MDDNTPGTFAVAFAAAFVVTVIVLGLAFTLTDFYREGRRDFRAWRRRREESRRGFEVLKR